MIFIENFIATVYGILCCAEWLYYYLKNKQKVDVSSEGPSSRVSSELTLDEGPSLETSSFCLFFKVVI
jgi:hypothetical protein